MRIHGSFLRTMRSKCTYTTPPENIRTRAGAISIAPDITLIGVLANIASSFQEPVITATSDRHGHQGPVPRSINAVKVSDGRFLTLLVRIFPG